MKAIRYTSGALRQLAILPPKAREAVIAKLHRYAETGAGDVKHLTGTDRMRLRSGDYRIVLLTAPGGIEVLAIAHRRDVYR